MVSNAENVSIWWRHHDHRESDSKSNGNMWAIRHGGNNWDRILPHDDVIEWKHLPRYWPFVRGIHRSPVNSPHKGQWRGAFMFSLICARINGWVNNHEVGDLRSHHTHYDVIVMSVSVTRTTSFQIFSTLHSLPYNGKFFAHNTKICLNFGVSIVF